ncbi:hypothetical protein ACWD6L_26820 [Micromonospora profundi]|uniref:Uncharacterized protein n=1 Tax=Micromonospora profundi TaxID=1420889 RepID=A0AAJ6HYB4_9ACTN|nr:MULTISPECIES: hypothetical protein [Micromonospora]NJC11029.1 hypothetical protein [Micromonospora profundi]WLS48537.1 hypothetical protein Q3V37_15615 [Micromonospora profundi]
MGGTDPGSAREEAERLVATVLAGARLASGQAAGGAFGSLGGMLSGVLGHSAPPGGGGSGSGAGGGFATGSAECCVCPVCRGIAALRDPSPEFAERLATGAGDLAAGVASLLRAFAPVDQPAADPSGSSAPTSPAPGQTTGPSGDDPAPQPHPTDRSGSTDDDHVWRDATRSGHDSQPAPERDVWSVATRTAGPPAPATAVPVDEAGSVAAPAPTSRPVVPASRVPDDTGADAPGDVA